MHITDGMDVFVYYMVPEHTRQNGKNRNVIENAVPNQIVLLRKAVKNNKNDFSS